MTAQKEAVLWGAVAGAATVLTELLALDPASLFSDFNWATFLGYTVKTLGLMVLGAMVVRVNQETSIQKAFQLGIMAPALIVGLQSGANVGSLESELEGMRRQFQLIQEQGSTQGANAAGNSSQVTLPFIAIAFADDPVGLGEHQSPAFSTRFWQGFSGQPSKGWFVVVGSHKTRQAATMQVERLAQLGWQVKVGDAKRWGGFFSVLIGSHLTQDRAIALRDLAIEQGLPANAYLWRQ